MKPLKLIPLLVLSASIAATAIADTYVLVHGAWGGSWAWKEIETMLEEKGHKVYRPALTGHGERFHLSHPDIDLSTHIADVIAVLEWEQLEDVILMGHSYGGMVVTGVADRVPERIKRIVYLDAIVPEDGESVNSAFGRDSQDSAGPGRQEGGFSIPPWVPEGAPIPHDVPHSLKCFTEELALKKYARMELPTTYVYLVDPGLAIDKDVFHPFYIRATEYEWKVIVKEEWDHNPQWSRPAELSELLHSES